MANHPTYPQSQAPHLRNAVVSRPARAAAFSEGGGSSRMLAKLRDTRGFMLAEQLVSIIFIGLLCIVISAGLGAALSAYANITQQTNADNLLVRAVESVSDEMAFALSVECGDEYEADPAFVSASQRKTAVFNTNELGIWLQVDDGAHVNLVPRANGLAPVLTDVVYYSKAAEVDGKQIPAGTWTFHVLIKPENAPDTEVLAQTTMQVTRMGS